MRNIKIGLIVPSSNTTLESESNQIAPKGVTFHSSRVKSIDTTVNNLRMMNMEVERAAELLGTADLDLIVYGCTSGSFIGGYGYDKEISERIKKASGIEAISTSTAVIEALKKFTVRKVAVATPYISELNKKVKKFLEENNFIVSNIKGLGIIKNTEIGSQKPNVAYNLAIDAFTEDSDGIFISCTNFPTVTILERAEKEVNKPTISSNQATLWLTFRTIGINEPIKGYGKLLTIK